jgi:predicted MFS family arabinose efflux permease
MQSPQPGKAGIAALLVAHCAGMVDLVALPVWMGALIAHHQLDAQRAGALVTLFLAGAVAASVLCAPRFGRLPGRAVACAGFAASALAFALLARTPASAWGAMAALHAMGGFAAGAALSMTHGTLGRGANPHRLFAYAGLALGLFALGFMVTVPPLVAARGAPAFFAVLAGIMAVAATVAMLAFPRVASGPAGNAGRTPLPAAVWRGVLGISAMAVVQAMMFSFIERIGMDRGFGQANVHGVLVAIGLVNLLPAVLAGLLENRLPARAVLLAGPVLQAAIAIAITHSMVFGPYAFAVSICAFVMIFTHTFVFGLLARLDPSGRAVSATPAMVMTGAAVGPVLGGTLVNAWGYPALGLAAAAVAALAFAFFHSMRPAVPARAHEQHP